uniref:Putative secreted protein n=1 Tax=Anopheles triannulatus TaxID=58253 RepID=A0A2M4B773_9DIPT
MARGLSVARSLITSCTSAPFAFGSSNEALFRSSDRMAASLFDVQYSTFVCISNARPSTVNCFPTNRRWLVPLKNTQLIVL